MATKASCEIQLRNSKKKTSLKEGMNLYDPSHGVGQIMSIEKKTILGETAVFCKLYFSRDDMNMLMPVSQMVENGIREIISAEEAKKYTKAYVPPTELVNALEAQIKRGERHIQVWTTRWCRDAAEDFAKYCRSQGYTNAHIHDVYNQRTGQKGGNYLKIDLE